MTRITKLNSAYDLNFRFNFTHINSLPLYPHPLNLDFNTVKSYILSVIMRTIGIIKLKEEPMT